MRLFTILVAAILVGVGIGYAATVAEFGISPPLPQLGQEDYHKAAGPMPLLAVDNLVHKFGTMRQNEEDQHTFVLRNAGRGPLVIKPGKPSCKCAVSKVSRSIIPPGETAEVTLEWKTGNSRGLYRKNAPIQTNDPKRSWVRLVVEGTVVPDFQFEPALIWVRTLSPHAASTHEAKLISYTEKPLELLDHKFSNEETKELFDLRYQPIGADDLPEHATSGFVITVAIKDGMPIGPVRQNITFVTSPQTRTPVRLNFTGDVREDIMIFGPAWDRKTETLDLGTAVRGQGRKVKLSLHVHGEHKDDLQIDVREVVPADLQVTVGERSELPDGVTIRYPLEIVVPEDAAATELSGETPQDFGRILLGTTHPEYPEMDLKLKLRVVD